MIKEDLLNRIRINNAELRDLIREYGVELTVKKGEEILREGQFVKVVPIVVEGLLKVTTRYNGKELLLYYIQPAESCIMSFTSSIQEKASKIYALAEEDTHIIGLPARYITELTRTSASLNQLFLDQYSHRYLELIGSLNHLLFDSLEDKVISYLRKKISLSEGGKLKTTHRQIASDLGSSREVITRILKKLESRDIIKQINGEIYFSGE